MDWKRCAIIAAIVLGAAAVSGCAVKRKHQQKGEPSAAGEKVEEAAVAGLFYPAEKEALTEMVDGFLSKAEAPPLENVRGLVSPHAGYPFSGQTAAYAYKQLAGREIQTVVVMAPSHYALFRGAALPDVAKYRTPLGTLELSPKAKELAKTRPFIINPPCEVRRPDWSLRSPKKAPAPGKDTPHTWEHSLEVQLPFLQRTLKDFMIIPIVFAPEDLVDIEKAAQVLMEHVDEKTLLVASSDLSHYNPYQVARRKDEACIKAICDLDLDEMKKQEACGKGPILTLMHIAREKGWKAKLLDYRNSGDTTGSKAQVVGYAAIAFFEPKESEGENK